MNAEINQTVYSNLQVVDSEMRRIRVQSWDSVAFSLPSLQQSSSEIGSAVSRE